jgi:cellulose synthase/poly-beta-1,6-N-acetylglucosamine synthase-like glycosyltransferase
VPDLSAIVLCYRAGESIRRVIEPLYEDLDHSGVDCELVLVANYDQGAADSTPKHAQEFAAAHDRVSTVVKAKEGAMGWDMRSGLEAARGELMIVIDGDAQNPVSDVLRMYREMRQTGADVMKGRRVTRLDSLYRHFISFAYNLLFFLMFWTRGLWDINGKPKGLTRSAYEQLDLRSDDWFIDAEIVIKARRAGLLVAEMPVSFRSNEERRSFVKASAFVEFLKNMLAYLFRRS